MGTQKRYYGQNSTTYITQCGGGGREIEKERAINTLCKALPNSSPLTKYFSLSKRDSDGVHPLASELHVV